jgi:hypothetical protein
MMMMQTKAEKGVCCIEFLINKSSPKYDDLEFRLILSSDTFQHLVFKFFAGSPETDM